MTGPITPANGPDDPRLLDIDAGFRQVLADLSFMARVSRISKTRFFHPDATIAQGELTVLGHLTFPAHDFFTPGRRFAVLARYSNAAATDDIAPDLRGVSLRLSEPDPSAPDRLPAPDSLPASANPATQPAPLLDLTMNVGECFFARSAALFQQHSAGGAIRDALFEREPRLLDVMWAGIRRPIPYPRYEYYSQAPRCFVTEDGTTWLARFRLRPTAPDPSQPSRPHQHSQPGHDDSVYDHGTRRYPPDPPDLLPRESGDPRPPTFLHDELRAELTGPGVDGLLQVQLHPLSGTPADETALDCSLPWPAAAHPWHDLARLRLTGLADPALVDGMSFNVAHAPRSLGIALARSPHENASLNHLRALVYRMASLARTGQALPPGLAGLGRPHPGPQTFGPAGPITATPAPLTTITERPPGPRTVCVIGAGAGLAAARELHLAGHRPIVLEARPDVGGKCDSIEVEGRAFDLGGHLCTVAYERVAALATELGAATEPVTPALVYDTATHGSSPQSSAFFHRESFQRYASLRARQFAAIAEPGLAHSARALARPVGEWLAEHDLTALAESFATGYTAAGYGFLTGDLPALYFVKYAEMTGLLSSKPSLLGHAGAFTVAGGFRGLWQRAAGDLPDVRCGVRIDRIDRTGGRVRVHTAQGLVEADDLVLTVPVSQLLPLLDATQAERDLAGRVRALDYQTTICTISGLPRSAFYLIRQATDPGRDPARDGHCVSFHHRYPDRDVYACYSYGPAGTHTDPEATLARDVERLGGQLGDIHTHREWSFLPHFGSADLAGGVYDRIEHLQGETHTYHAGSLPAFELVECAVGHAQDLVRRHFPPPARSAPASTALTSTALTITTRPGAGPDEIREWLVKHIAVEACLCEPDVDPDRPLEEFALDSLSVAALQGELSDWLGYRVPHAIFLTLPTIDALAAHLADSSARTGPGTATRRAAPSFQPPEGLLPLTPPRPFFCLGGAAGTASYLRPLARALGPAQPFYGVQAPGLTGDDEPLDDVADIADHALSLLQQVQPHGPYLLGGHSFGGLVAYELGLALRARGEQAHVILLDTYVPVPGQLPPPEDEFACITELFTMHRLMHAAQLADQPADLPSGLALQPGQSPEQQYELLGRALGATGGLPVDEYLARLIRVYQNNLAATVAYRPPPSGLPVTLFKATGGFPPVLDGDRQVELRVDDPANGWNPAGLPALRTVPVPGNHFSMLAAPHVDRLAIALRARLRAALTLAAQSHNQDN